MYYLKETMLKHAKQKIKKMLLDLLPEILLKPEVFSVRSSWEIENVSGMITQKSRIVSFCKMN